MFRSACAFFFGYGEHIMSQTVSTTMRSAPMSRDKTDTLLLMIACIVVLLPHAMNVAWWVSATCACLLAWRGWLTFSGRRLPKPIVLLPIAALLMTGVYLNFRTFFGREVGVTMLALLLTCKLLEMHAKRDLFSVIYLSLFLVLTSYFSSQTMFSAALSLFAVLLLLTAQVSFQYTGLVPAFKERAKFGALILGLAIPLTIVAFLFFPRINGPLWSLPSDSHKGKTGLSETMAPGNIGELAQSEEIAFRVKFLNLPPNITPPKSELYWRGIVLNDFDGRTWEKDTFNRAGGSLIVNTTETAIRQQIVLEPAGQRWMLALDVPGDMPPPEGMETRMSAAREIRSREPINSRVRYEVNSHLRYALDSDADDDSLRRALVLPAGFNPKTREFAAQLRASIGAETHSASNAALIQLVLRHFREQGFEYTLEPPLLGVDSVDDFLFKTRAGFCEHYASAFVVLMRAMQIPARVVTGYQGGEMNKVDGYLEVRQSAAHAWAEVWLPSRGWIRIDPTASVAPSRISIDLSATQPRSRFSGLVSFAVGGKSIWTDVRMRFDALNNSWNQWVLNYNQGTQINFMRKLGFSEVDWSSMAIVLFSAGAGIMGIMALVMLRNRPKVSPLDRLYLRLCQRLESKAKHLARAPHESASAYSQRLESQLSPQQYAPIKTFLALYAHAKYAPTKRSQAQLEQQLQALLVHCR
jgi:protein-glutamine gamma-glutamyltransferase